MDGNISWDLPRGPPRAQQPPQPKGSSLCSQESCAIALVLLREYERAPSSKSSVSSFQHSRTSGVETILFTASQNLDVGTSSCRRLPQTSRRRISGSVTSLPRPVAPGFRVTSSRALCRPGGGEAFTKQRKSGIPWFKDRDAAPSLHQWKTEPSPRAGLPREEGQPTTRVAWEGAAWPPPG